MADPATYIVGVVDDDSRMLESLEELLESAGHGVRLYTSAKELLDDDGISQIDCLISDVGMPAMDGFTLQRLVRVARPALPVILITGRHELATVKHNLKRGGRLLFEKPFNGPELLAAVSAEIRASRRGG